MRTDTKHLDPERFAAALDGAATNSDSDLVWTIVNDAKEAIRAGSFRFNYKNEPESSRESFMSYQYAEAALKLETVRRFAPALFDGSVAEVRAFIDTLRASLEQDKAVSARRRAR
jgi:hypothetical protein